MHTKPYKFVQHRASKVVLPENDVKACSKREELLEQPLLFVHRNGKNVRKGRTAVEAQAITTHIAGQHWKWRRGHKKVTIHPSTSKILADRTISEKVCQKPGTKAARILDSCLHGKLRYVRPNSNIVVSDCHLCPASLEMFKPGTSSFGEPAFDPFTPAKVELSPKVKNYLYLYFQIIHPFAKFLHSDWAWFDSIPELQTTPMLCYAVAAYSSLFFNGLRTGSEGVILPPPVHDQELHEPLWAIPDWFRFQTSCLSHLNKTITIADQDHSSVFHTVLFLLRLSVLLADGASARVHLRALKEISKTYAEGSDVLELESTVIKVNLISAFIHQSAIFTSDQKDEAGASVRREVQHDPEKWIDGIEWKKCQSMVHGRTLTWLASVPSVSMEQCVNKSILDADQKGVRLNGLTFRCFNDCYQIALHIWAYLIGINFETSLPHIRLRLTELQERLELLDLHDLWEIVPTSLFNILFAGAFASRGFIERAWFVELLASGTICIRYMHELHMVLSKFTDPEHAKPRLLEELLREIVAAREDKACVFSESTNLYSDPLPQRGHMPLSQNYDFSVPITHVAAC